MGVIKRDAKNINEIFKFTCQRYHSYISQIIDYLKNKEAQILVQGDKMNE